MDNSKKIILDLCGGTGSWSKPYQESCGYDVRLVTLPEHDVRLYIPPDNVHGILAAPPCEHFARVGARWWKDKGQAALLDGLSVVDACLRIIYRCQPVWWALENPIGRLQDYLGKPAYKFAPWWFGDPWTKRTWLWGNFTMPAKNEIAIRPVLIGVPRKRDRIAKMSSSWKVQRSITPPGFAKAFFEANL